MQHRTKTHTQKGSFLLELLVAFAIISISLTVIVDSFITTQRSYRTAIEQAELTRVVTRVFEDMSIEARVSAGFSCGATLPDCSGSIFSMEHIEDLNNQSAGEIVSYRLHNNKIQKDNLGAGYVDMTPPIVEVTDFYVEVVGDSSIGEEVQALITLTARDADNPAHEVHVQTSFTERKY